MVRKRPTNIDLIFHREKAGTALHSARSDHNLALAPRVTAACIRKLLAMRGRIERAIANEEPLAPADLNRIGDALADVMFVGDVGRLYDHAAGSGIRLSFCAGDAELKAIPWEFVRWPDVQACPHTERSMARLVTVSNTKPQRALSLHNGLRVLLVVSQPQDQDTVEWVETQVQMETIFGAHLPGAAGRKVELILQEAASPTAVLNSVKQHDPHIIHFIGHGNPQGLYFTRHQSAKSQLVTIAQLHNIFSCQSLRLVILSACDTAKDPGSARPLASIAEQIVQAGATAVVANQMPISLRSVAQFCGGLYRSLLSGGNIDQAVNDGRIAVGVEYDNVDAAAVDWGIPVLYRRPGCSQLFG